MFSVTTLFALPFLSAALLLLGKKAQPKMIKTVAFFLSLLPLVLLVLGYRNWIGSSVDFNWIPPLGIHFHLSIDALSLLFLFLTAFVVPLSILSQKSDNLTKPYLFYSLILVLEGLLIGFFTAKDLALFTLFWEAMLLPLYFIILIWGGNERQRASLKFLIYMIAGSCLMVAAVLFLYFAAATTGLGTFDFTALLKIAESAPYAISIFAIFLLAFAVKTPLFPFHAWLPDAYTQAPTAGTILLSALLSKAGIYGILRIGLQFFGHFIQEWSFILIPLAIAGVLYAGLTAWMQNDFKKLIAYSSLSHVNFILVGLFVWNQTAQAGAILQALNHGITIAALFLVVGWLQERLNSTSLNEATGVAKFFPRLCWVTLLFVLSSVALPGTNSFIGELLILFGLFIGSPILTLVLGLTVIVSVIYMLRWIQNVYFGPSNEIKATSGDLRKRELLIALPLIAMIFWIGLYPAPLLDVIQPTAEKIEKMEK